MQHLQGFLSDESLTSGGSCWHDCRFDSTWKNAQSASRDDQNSSDRPTSCGKRHHACVQRRALHRRRDHSVRSQTFADLELIVVDDGSTDGTAAVVERHARADSRVRLIRQPNRGLSTARNLALERSSGAYIAILDSDDAWTPWYLASQMEILHARPDVDIVTANAWFLGGAQTGQPAAPSPDPRPDPDLCHLLGDETAVFIMSVFRRRVDQKIGGFDESFRSNEDYDFWIRAAVAGFRFVRNDRPAGYYRRRDDSLSADELRMLKGILRVYVKTSRHHPRPAASNWRSWTHRLNGSRRSSWRPRHAMRSRRRPCRGAALRPRPPSAPRRCGSGPRQHDGEMGSGLLSRAYHARRVGLYGT